MSNTQASSKTPSHFVYHVREREGKPGFFTKIGAAWPHKDERGFSLSIDMVPLDGQLSLRIAEEETR